MKLSTYFFSIATGLLLLAMSCGVTQAFDDMIEVGNAIEEEFGHTVRTGLSWNNDVRSWTISFTRFNIDELNHDELEKMAEEVHEFIMDEFRKAEDQDFILIRFSPDEDIDDDTREKAEFRFDH